MALGKLQPILARHGVPAGLVPELMILEALPVTVERDRWDWLLYVLSLAAAATAIVLFLPWALASIFHERHRQAC